MNESCRLWQTSSKFFHWWLLEQLFLCVAGTHLCLPPAKASRRGKRHQVMQLRVESQTAELHML